MTLYRPAAGASRRMTFSVVSSRIFLISALAFLTCPSVGPSIRRNSLRSPAVQAAGGKGHTRVLEKKFNTVRL